MRDEIQKLHTRKSFATSRLRVKQFLSAYVIGLSLFGLPGLAAPQAAPSAVGLKRFSEIPVEMATGEFVQRETPDLRIKSRGLIFEVSRNYRSRREAVGVFGYGWGWNHGERLEFPGDLVINYVTPDGTLPIIPDVSYTSSYARVCMAAPSWSQGEKATGQPDAMGGYGNVAHYYGAIASLQPLVVGGWSFVPPAGPSTILQVDLASIGATAYDADHPQYGLSLKLSAGGAASVDWGHRAYDFDYVDITADRASWSWADVNAVQARLELGAYTQNVPMDVIADTFHLGITYTRNADGEYKYLPGSTFELVKTNNEYWINNKNRSQLAFALDGRLLRKTDASGNTLSFLYDEAGRLIGMADDLRQSISFSYENGLPDAKITRLTDHLGRSVGYAYLGDDLVAVTNVLGAVTRYAYATTEGEATLRHNLVRRTDPVGNAVSLEYYTTNSTPDRVWRYRDGERTEGLTNEVDYLYLKGTTYSWRPGAKSIQGVVYNASNDVSQVYVREGDLTYRESDGLNLVAQHAPTRVASANTSVWEHIESALGVTNGVMAFNPSITTNSALEVAGWGFAVPGLSNDIVQVVLSVRGMATNPVCLSVAGVATTNWASSNTAWVVFDITRAKAKWTWSDVSNMTAKITPPAGATNAVPVWVDGFSLKVAYRHFDPGQDPQDLFYFYDLSHNLVASDRGGCAHQFAYDGRGNLVAWTDPENHTRRYEYDPVFNKPVRTWDPAGRVTVMDYDAAGRLSRTTDAAGNVSTLTYDRYGNVVRTTDGDGAVEETIYDQNGLNVVKSRNRRGFETGYEFDAYGNCTRVNAPDGGRRHATYNAGGWKLSERDEAGVETRYEYDANGSLTNIIHAAGTLEEFSEGRRLDGRGLEIARLDPFGRAEWTEYDAEGRPFCQTDRLGGQTVTEYDENGYPWRVTDPLGQTRETLRDGRGNITASLDRRGARSSCVYDGNNHPILTVDPVGNRVMTTWDEQDNKSQETYQWAGYPGCPEAERPALLTLTYAYDALNRVTNKTEGVGRSDARVTSTRYNAAGRIIAETDPRGNVRHHAYDACGNLTNTCLVDASGKWVEWATVAYDSADREVLKISGGLATNRFEYDLRGLKVASVDPLGRRTTFTYDRHRRLVATIAPDGTTHQVAYDRCGNKVREVPGGGAVSGFEWDAAGRQVRQIEGVGRPDARINTCEYDPLGRLTARVNPLGHRTRTTYDGEGNVASETDASGAVKTFGYDAAGRVTNTVDAFGAQIAQTLDGRGKLCVLRDKRGGTTRSRYDVYGRLIHATDALGNRVTFGYDAGDNKISETDPRGTITRYEYDGANRVTHHVAGVGLAASVSATTVFDPLGRAVRSILAGHSNSPPVVIARAFDAAGNLLAMTNAGGAVTCHAYDVMDRLIEVRDAAGGVTQTQYDSRGNVVARIDALGGLKRFSYDVYGQLRTHTDEAGATTRYEVDLLGRVTNTVDAIGNRESRQWDAGDHLVRVQAPDGAVSSFEYDQLGRLTNTVDAAGYQTRKTVDAAGNVICEIDRRGGRTRYEYDALNRPVAISDPASNTLAIAYDSTGNKIREVLPSGLVITYGYDGLGRQVLKTVGAGRADARRTRYELDSAGRVVVEWNPLGQGMRMSYDANGNKTNSVDARGNQTRFEYDSLNRLTRTTDALGQAARVDYDALGRVVQASNRRGAVTRHQYDVAGHLISLQDAEGNLKQNRYDLLGRLIEEQEPNGLRTHLSYDAAGRVTNRTSIASDGECRSESMGYDLLGRQIISRNAMGLTTEFEYDANGNRVVESARSAGGALLRTKSAEYNSRNQPVREVDYQGATWLTEYDAIGRRVATLDPLGNRTLFEWSVYNELIATTDPAGFRTESTYDRCGRETERLDALGQRTRYRYDPNGNRVAVINDNGKAIVLGYDSLNRLSARSDALPDVPPDVLTRSDVNGDGHIDAADVAALEGALQ
jgi:YD repeat-containing protein